MFFYSDSHGCLSYADLYALIAYSAHFVAFFWSRSYFPHNTKQMVLKVKNERNGKPEKRGIFFTTGKSSTSVPTAFTAAQNNFKKQKEITAKQSLTHNSGFQ